MKTAFVIIDVQNIMFEYEGGVSNGDVVVDNIQSLLVRARGKSIPVIFIQHTADEGPFKPGNDLWEIHEKIKPLDDEIVIRKYSWDSFLDTALDDKLKTLGTGKLIIAGMQTEFCVDTTIRRAYSAGYTENIVVSDGHATFDTEELTGAQIVSHHNSIWGGRFATLKTSSEIEM